jgi:hypothetical protein
VCYPRSATDPFLRDHQRKVWITKSRDACCRKTYLGGLGWGIHAQEVA